MAKDLIEKTVEYVRLKLKEEHTGHDWYHVERVWKMAKHLQSQEGGDLELIELSALLHDLGDDKNYEFSSIKGNLILYGMMDILEIETEMQEKIIKVVEDSQWHASESKKPKSLEAQIVQDADWLDSVGAVGLARTFATGGDIKRIIHDPKRKPRPYISAKDYTTKKRESTSINQIYEKVLRIPEKLNTVSAQKIAVHRYEFVKEFLDEFYLEWDGQDVKE